MFQVAERMGGSSTGLVWTHLPTYPLIHSVWCLEGQLGDRS